MKFNFTLLWSALKSTRSKELQSKEQCYQCYHKLLMCIANFWLLLVPTSPEWQLRKRQASTTSLISIFRWRQLEMEGGEQETKQGKSRISLHLQMRLVFTGSWCPSNPDITWRLISNWESTTALSTTAELPVVVSVADRDSKLWLPSLDWTCWFLPSAGTCPEHRVI